MAKKKSAKAAGKLSQDKVRSIWKALNLDSWLDFLNRVRPSHNWRQKGNEVWGNCIYHSDSTASFHIRFNDGYAKCFGSCNHFESDPLEFAAKALGKSYADAFSYLVTTYGLTGFATNLTQEIQDFAKRKELKQYILNIFNRELCEAASSGRTAPQFAYAQPLVAWLHARNIPLNLLHTLPIGVVPPTDRLWERLKELEAQTKIKWHHEIQEYLEKIVPASPVSKGIYEGWILFANHTTPGNIGFFRIREPASKSGLVVIQEPGYPVDMGYFGLGAGLYQSVIGDTENPVSKKAIVVEGEFDAMAAMIPQIISSNPQAVVICAGGNNNHCMDDLESVGIEEVLILGDYDEAGEKFVSAHLQNSKIKSRIFSWPRSITVGKDLHDAYMNLGGPAVLTELTNDSNFLYPQEWALAKIESERSLYSSKDVGSLAQLAMRYARMLTNPTEQEVFIAEASKILSVPDTQIKKYAASPDTDSGFAAMFEAALVSTYRFVYKEQSEGSVKITAWDRKHNKQVVFPMSKERELTSVLGSDVGSLSDFISEHAIEPTKFKDMEDETGKLIQVPDSIKNQYYSQTLINTVMPRIAKNLPMLQHMTMLGQGIHYEDGHFYCVNGNRFYRGEVQADDSVFWIDIDGNVDGKYLVERSVTSAGEKGAWSNTFANANDINSVPPIELPRLVKTARDIFNTGWLFKDHELESMYFACYIFCIGMNVLFNEKPWLFINSPASSGKTYLVKYTLSGTSSDNSTQLLENSFGCDIFSEAGVRNGIKNATIPLIVDEFELGMDKNANNKKHQASRDLLDTLRASFSGGSTISMSNQRGESVKYKLNSPVVCAGINQLMNRADTSRFNTVYMANIGLTGIRGSTPVAVIKRNFKPEIIEEVRRGVTLFALKNIYKFKKELELVKEEFSAGQHFDPGAWPRMRETLFPILTIAKLVGWDYKQFAKSYSGAKVARFKDTYSMNEYDDVWNTILHAPGVKLPIQDFKDRTFTVAEILMDPHKRASISESNSGIYYIPGRNYIIVSWPTVVHSLLKGSQFSGRDPRHVKSMAAQDSRVLKPEVIRTDGTVMMALKQYGLTSLAVSVMPLPALLEDSVVSEKSSSVEEIFTKKPNSLKETTKLEMAVSASPIKGDVDNI